VRLTYRSPWRDESVVHDFEPWQVWLHDGVLYVRGHSRTRRAVRTFRLANVESVVSVPNAHPIAPVPANPWAGEEPRYGIDEDRPNEAVLRFVVMWRGGSPQRDGIRRSATHGWSATSSSAVFRTARAANSHDDWPVSRTASMLSSPWNFDTGSLSCLVRASRSWAGPLAPRPTRGQESARDRRNEAPVR